MTNPNLFQTIMGQTSTTDTLTLSLSEDTYKGDAQFAVTVDGASVGSVQTVTASHAAGAQQTFTLAGSWDAEPHKVSVKYLNTSCPPMAGSTAPFPFTATKGLPPGIEPPGAKPFRFGLRSPTSLLRRSREYPALVACCRDLGPTS